MVAMIMWMGTFSVDELDMSIVRDACPPPKKNREFPGNLSINGGEGGILP